MNQYLYRLVVPPNFTKMSLWILCQDDKFFFTPKQSAISGILMKELNITAAQGRKLAEHREKIRAICSSIKKVICLLAKLKSICEQKQKNFKSRMDKCQEILTPLQVCKLLVWFNDNLSIIHKVCPGWGSEKIQNTKPEGKTKSSNNNSESLSPPPPTASATSDDNSLGIDGFMESIGFELDGDLLQLHDMDESDEEG